MPSGKRLARALGDFGVSPRNLRFGSVVRKGYLRSDLEEPWARYLPAASSPEDSPATTATVHSNTGLSDDFAPATLRSV